MKKIKIILLFIFGLTLNSSYADTVQPIIDGNDDAKIKIIIFESLTCSHCANFHKNVYPDLKKEFIDKGILSIEYKSFPLNIAALNASKLAHCNNDGNSKLLHFLYDNQSKWANGSSVEELNKNLINTIKSGNFNIDDQKCLDDKILEDHVLNDRIEGVKKFNINSTPTLLINGKKFEKSITFKNLKKSIEKLL
tara:strand:+ start:492 stop:1073 length:582 start_codon:yes stop_codon:yes gene_type:complete